MQFIEAGKLKRGMRLARPIYNKRGVLLFERDSRLTPQAIESVRNFGLLGVYVLDPAEPVPPMTEADLEFERFQTMAIFSIREELERILTTERQSRMQTIANMVIRSYGQKDEKIYFYQSLRSREDFVYKHSLNAAILSALISHKMKLGPEAQLRTVISAVIHDIGKVSLTGELLDSDEQTPDTVRRLSVAQASAMELVEAVMEDGGEVRRLCVSAQKARDTRNNSSVSLPAKILMVANRYDEMTCMKLGSSTDSEVRAVRELLENPQMYDKDVVKALVDSIKILFPGVSVELNNGEKGLVLAENPEDILRPYLLNFRDNNIIDLAAPSKRRLWIKDILKTLDNRHVIDTETLRKAGYPVREEPEAEFSKGILEEK